jgi:hypothetical protein
MTWSTAFSRTARKPPRRDREIAAGPEAERCEIEKMRRDRHARLVDDGGMLQQQIAIVHRQRQRAARLELAADHLVDVRHHRLQRRRRQVHIGETLGDGAVGGRERLVELEQHHRARSQDDLADAMGQW